VELASKSAGSTLAALAAALWLVTALLVVAFLYGERRETLKNAAVNGEALVMALDAHTARTIEAVDVTLAGVAAAVRAAPGRRPHDFGFQQALAERLHLLQPYARAIFVVGADGRIEHDTDFPTTPELPLDDRDYFQAHRDDPDLVRSIGRPLRSRSGLGWFLPVTRRIGDAEFRGIVVAALQPQYFEALYSRLGLGSADAVMLFHRDGTLIARYPHEREEIGSSFAGFALFATHLPRAPAGTYLTRAGLYPHERLVSYRALDDLPLIVAMGQSTQTILKSWRDTALVAALALGALAVLLAALVAQFMRQQRVRDLARERTVQSEKLEALGHLTGGVSHDFANLLNVVSASLRVIQAKPDDTQRVREAVAVSERAVVRGSQLVEQLRMFARRQPLHVHPADLNLLIVSGIELLRQAAGPGPQLHTELGAVPLCLLDETELEVALVNLLVNAKDAGASSVLLKTFASDKAAGSVCLAVTDDGRGMTAEVRRRLFEPYFSTKGTRGTGLGLAQVYGFLRQIGGDVQIESAPGKGTTVTLVFPRAPAAARSPALTS
jgi:two-component system NtrC family sensor kinase